MYQKRFVVIVIIMLILSSGSFALSESDFLGEYKGNLKITSYDDELINMIAEDAGMTKEDFIVGLKSELEGDLYVEIIKNNNGHIIIFEETAKYPAIIKGTQLSFVMPLSDSVSLNFKATMKNENYIEGSMVIKTPVGNIAKGPITMEKIADYTDEDIEYDSESEEETAEGESMDMEESTEEQLTDMEEKTVNEMDAVDEIEENTDKFFPITDTREKEFRKTKALTVQQTEEKIKGIVKKNPDLMVKETLSGRKKIERREEGLTYEQKKKIVEFTGRSVDKVVGESSLKYGTGIVKNKVKNYVYDRDDKIRDIQENLGMNRNEARGYKDVSAYEEREEKFSVVKEFVLNKAGFAGDMVQKQLDKLSNAKKKAMGKAAAREYRIFADAYVKARQNNSNKEAIRIARDRIKAQGEDALQKGEEYITFRDGVSNFFKEPIKFMSYKILNRDSKKKSYKERSALYISYLKEDEIYFSEGGN